MNDRPEGGQSGGDARAEDREDAADGAASTEVDPGPADAAPDDVEALRERVEAEYDFDDFGPQDMAEMSVEEWEAAFDDEAWITGPDLLDRVEADLRSRVADRDVFAVVERIQGDDPRVVAYSDRSFAIVHADGTIEGEGAVLRDVKPTVALASMPEYDVPEPPDGGGLPAPRAVPDAGSRLGNWMLQLVGAVLLVAAVVLFGASVVGDLGGATIVAATMGLIFLVVGGALLFTVANARLSARYRAEEFRDRLRAAGVDAGERPDFLPIDDSAFDDVGADGELPDDDTESPSGSDPDERNEPTDADAGTDGDGSTEAGARTDGEA